jgi:hypothetical protein
MTKFELFMTGWLIVAVAISGIMYMAMVGHI